MHMHHLFIRTHLILISNILIKCQPKNKKSFLAKTMNTNIFVIVINAVVKKLTQEPKLGIPKMKKIEIRIS